MGELGSLFSLLRMLLLADLFRGGGVGGLGSFLPPLHMLLADLCWGAWEGGLGSLCPPLRMLLLADLFCTCCHAGLMRL